MTTRTTITPSIEDGEIRIDVTEEPVRDQPCVTCPFYGMIGTRYGIIMGGPTGNACALTFAHSPCKMEMRETRPDWDGCTFFNVPAQSLMVDKVMAGYRSYPESRHPPGEQSWEGMTMPEWFEAVMGRPWGRGQL